MSQEQRKMALISWIIQLDSDAALQQVEALKDDLADAADVPAPIMALLNASAATHPQEMMAHTSAREIMDTINAKK